MHVYALRRKYFLTSDDGLKATIVSEKFTFISFLDHPSLKCASDHGTSTCTQDSTQLNIKKYLFISEMKQKIAQPITQILHLHYLKKKAHLE